MFESPSSSTAGHTNDVDLKNVKKAGKGKTKSKDKEPTGKATPAGRKDSQGQQHAITLDPLKKSLKELEQLSKKAADSKEAYSIAVKAVAEKSGLMASVVGKLIKARVEKKHADKKREFEQLDLVFTEIGA